MSQNILKKLVERFAPETVKEKLALIEHNAQYERQIRGEREQLEQELLSSLKVKHPETEPAVLVACAIS